MRTPDAILLDLDRAIRDSKLFLSPDKRDRFEALQERKDVLERELRKAESMEARELEAA